MCFRTCNLINGQPIGTSLSEFGSSPGRPPFTSMIIRYPASSSCVSITPDESSTWVTEDSLPQGRVMGNFVIMPNGKFFLVNGGNTGVVL